MLFPERLGPPPLVSAVMIPCSLEADSFKRIERLERPPPHRYVLARQLFASVLHGQSFDWALGQAKNSPDFNQRKYAFELLNAGREFLLSRQGLARDAPPSTTWSVSEELKPPVACHAVLGKAETRSIVLFHFWMDELPEDRLSIIKGALRAAIWQMPGWAGVNVELVVAPFVKALGRRNLRAIDCSKGNVPDDLEMQAFKGVLSDLWEAYHVQHPLRRWR